MSRFVHFVKRTPGGIEPASLCSMHLDSRSVENNSSAVVGLSIYLNASNSI